ncbi:hypothetical protein Agub_g11748, partial [Astrephomene gubernaculifera]
MKHFSELDVGRLYTFLFFGFSVLCICQSASLRLRSQQFNVSIVLQPATAEDAARYCLTESSLSGPGILAPLTLVLYVLQELVTTNSALLQSSLRQDPASYKTGGSSLWVLDPWGSCRAIILPSRLAGYTGAVELSWVPCSWSLQYVCMEYDTALSLSAGLTLPHNLYRTPNPPPLPPAVPLTADPSSGLPYSGLPPGYRLVTSGVKLGYGSPPVGAVRFSGLDAFLRLGPVVNIVGRWKPTGLDALRVVAAGDTSNVVELAMANSDLPDYFGDSSAAASSGSAPVWAANPMRRETDGLNSSSSSSVGNNSGNRDSSSGNSTEVLRTSYIRRVEGCSSNTAVHRLILVNAEGAAAAQGVVRCIANFGEEVAPGGFLAAVEGYYVSSGSSSTARTSSTSNSSASSPDSSSSSSSPSSSPSLATTSSTTPSSSSSSSSSSSTPSIVQLWFVWAVPENYTTATDPAGRSGFAVGGVHSVGPRLTPVVPRPRCGEARSLIPAGGSIKGAECGQFSSESYACPSYMCCGAARGRVGLCGTDPSSCLLSSCDPRFGLCGVVPADTLEVTPHEGIAGVAPAPSPLSTPPPYVVDDGSSTSSIYGSSSSSSGGSGSSVSTSTVRWGSSAYVLDKSNTFTYADAVERCRSQTLMGLTWRLAGLADAFAFEVSLLARAPFLQQLNARVAWVRPRPDNTPPGLAAPGCLTVSWAADAGSVQLVQVQAADCGGTASAICKADWPVTPSG